MLSNIKNLVSPKELKDLFSQILGNENVLSEESDLRFFSSDVYREADPVSLVIRPQNISSLASALELASKNSIVVIPRGGGLSYTDGYLPVRNNSIIVDLQDLDGIIEINEQDMFVVVEAGCNWEKLNKALLRKKLRTPYFGPLSGLHSTIGGAMSQNSIFFWFWFIWKCSRSVFRFRGFTS